LLNPWASEIWRLITLIILAVLVGLLSGELLVVLLVATVAYLCWHLTNLVRLEKWLRKGGSAIPPIGNGVWGELYYHIYRMRQRNRKSKRRLANVINRFKE